MGIKKLEIKQPPKPQQTNKENESPQNDEEEKYESNDDDIDDDQSDDYDIDMHSTSTSNHTKSESVTLSKTKESSLKNSLKYDVSKHSNFGPNTSSDFEYLAISTMFDKLGSTTKRLDKIEILSSLFRSILYFRVQNEWNSSNKKKDNALLYSVYLCIN